MKHLMISMSLIMGVFISANSQIKVAEDNNVGIGVTDPVSKLAVGGTGNTYSTLYVENSSTTSGQRAANFYKSASGDTGSDYSYSVIGHIVHNGGYKLIGGQFSAHSANTSNNRTFGVRGIAGNGYNGFNYGVFGYLYGTRDGAAIFGSTNGAEIDVNGKYAGYFDGDVWVDDDLIVFGNFSNPSDINLKKEIRPLRNEDTTQVAKLKSINAIIFKYKTPAELNSISPEIADTMKIDPRTMEYNSPKYTKDHIGFSAQEVLQVYPELVSESQDGYLTLNYIGLIPIITEAIKEQDEAIKMLETTLKEQDAQIEILKKEIAELKTLNK